ILFQADTTMVKIHQPLRLTCHDLRNFIEIERFVDGNADFINCGNPAGKCAGFCQNGTNGSEQLLPIQLFQLFTTQTYHSAAISRLIASVYWLTSVNRLAVAISSKISPVSRPCLRSAS